MMGAFTGAFGGLTSLGISSLDMEDGSANRQAARLKRRAARSRQRYENQGMNPRF